MLYVLLFKINIEIWRDKNGHARHINILLSVNEILMLACWSFSLIVPCETDGTEWGGEMLRLKWHLLDDKDLLKHFIFDSGIHTRDWNLCCLPQA